jgi:anaerobic dimethyl sulfoxide reductase subunit B (iron-sulfur subunit)
MMKRPAFFLDTQVCTGCKTCMLACKDKHDLPEGVRWRRVVEFSGGEWQPLADGTFNQNVFAYYLSVSCNHCQDPICVRSCPSKAMRQDDHGIVTIDPETCVGCRYCAWVCPYSAPQFDSHLGRMTKCDFCREEVERDRPPSCVAACPTRALRYGDLDDLQKAHAADLPMHPMPPFEMTVPSLVLAPHREGRGGPRRTGSINNPEEVKDGV